MQETTQVIQAKAGLLSMLSCYRMALLSANCGDPNQVIATEVAKALKMSNVQRDYILESSRGVSSKETLKNIEILLMKMEKDNTVDRESMAIIKQAIKLLVGMVQSNNQSEVIAND